MAVSQAEILEKAVEVLRADATLIGLLGETAPASGEARVYNHVPQDDGQPYLALMWQATLPYDTKDSEGFEGILEHEAVTTHHGDRDALKIMDAVRAAYNAVPIVLATGEVVCFDFQRGSNQTQVFETHRATAVFSVLVDDDGVGGVPPSRIVCAEPIRTIAAAGPTKGQADMADCVSVFKWTMTEDGQLDPQNVPQIVDTMVYLDLVLRQDGGGGHVFTPPANTIWDGGAAPVLDDSPNTKTRLLFTSDDGGINWEGFLAADAQA